jgi:hypothetical protein
MHKMPKQQSSQPISLSFTFRENNLRSKRLVYGVDECVSSVCRRRFEAREYETIMFVNASIEFMQAHGFSECNAQDRPIFATSRDLKVATLSRPPKCNKYSQASLFLRQLMWHSINFVACDSELVCHESTGYSVPGKESNHERIL